MKIHLHKNARTTPAQREYIQNTPDLSVARIAARLGVSETTVRRWKKRSSVLDRSHTPKRVGTTLTPFQELAAVLTRITLRCGLDDLLGLVQHFIFSRASRSGLNRCLNRYAIARLSPLQAVVGPDLKDYRGTCFYHTQIWLPGLPLTAVPLVADTLLDCSFKSVSVRFSPCWEKSSLPFIRKIISEFPFTPLAMVSVPPVFLESPGHLDAVRMFRQQTEEFCREKKIEFFTPDLISSATRQKLSRTWAGLEKDRGPRQRPAGPEQIQGRISTALDTYHTLPLRALRQTSPSRALLNHYREFPGSFVKKPTNHMGLGPPRPGPRRGRHPSCFSHTKTGCMTPFYKPEE